MIQFAKEQDAARHYISALDIRTPSSSQPPSNTTPTRLMRNSSWKKSLSLKMSCYWS